MWNTLYSKECDIAIITRKNDENVVLMSQAQYDNLIENLHIRESKVNYEWLKESIKQARSPYEGVGKPEPLKYDLAGKWSRRITDEQRLVYQVEGNNIIVFTCRYHY